MWYLNMMTEQNDTNSQTTDGLFGTRAANAEHPVEAALFFGIFIKQIRVLKRIRHKVPPPSHEWAISKIKRKASLSYFDELGFFLNDNSKTIPMRGSPE